MWVIITSIKILMQYKALNVLCIFLALRLLVFAVFSFLCSLSYPIYILKNSVVLVRKRTIPTQRPQPVGEVSTNS
jgi:hypothetical protein